MLLPFFDNDVQPHRTALINKDRSISYAKLIMSIKDWQNELPLKEKGLVFLYLENSIEVVAPLLAVLEQGQAVALLDINLSEEVKTELEEKYLPGILIFCQDDIISYEIKSPQGEPVNKELCVLLSTSGSTGSPKLVRLSKEAIKSNAFAIIASQNLDEGCRASGHLDIHYSYGMSVLFSHIAAGGSVSFSKNSFMERSFWAQIGEQNVTHLPGVPFHYEMLQRLRIERMELPSLMVMTQAGGRLDIEIQKYFHDMMAGKQGRFLTMYGQTEASPRIATLQHEDFEGNQGSVGQVMDGGLITIRDKDGELLPVGTEGIVQYQGPNVMMGYAQNRADLSRGDDLGGVLLTGDIGVLDDRGFLRITGRHERMGKIYGWRVNLDEVEKLSNQFIASAVVQIGDEIVIAQEGNEEDSLRKLFANKTSLPASVFRFVTLETISRTKRGKIDYKSLESDLS
jgi:acyl-coenzyme A synthetase/AMP-(fatty) acid ligase